MDSAAVLFLEHNVCFRETDPLNGRAYLVFPELINLKKPMVEDDDPTEDGVAYTVSGSVENVYASLVVLMGYTQTFTRTNQWRNQARYEVGRGIRVRLPPGRRAGRRAGFRSVFRHDRRPLRCERCSRASSRTSWAAAT